MEFALLDPALWGLFFSSFLAATILPIGSEPILAGLILAKYPPFACLAYATIGNTLGGITSYYLGWLGKWEWIERYLKIPKHKVEKFSHRIHNYGAWVALLTWLPVIGDPLAVALGFFKINRPLVFSLMLIGKAIRYAILIYVLI